MEEFVLHSGVLEEKAKKPISYDIRWHSKNFAKGIVLFVHGFKGFKDWGFWSLVGDRFAKEGFVFMKINLSHNGTTPDNLMEFSDLEAFGNNNFSHEINDIGRTIKGLKNGMIPLPKGIKANQVKIIGHSKGGASVLIASAEKTEIEQVVTWAAIDDIADRYATDVEEWKRVGVKFFSNARTKQNMPVYYQLFNDIAQNSIRFHLKGQLTKFDKPLLICHGTDDLTVDVSAAHHLKEWCPSAELLIVPGANHVFNGSHPYQKPELPNAMKTVVNETIRFFS